MTKQTKSSEKLMLKVEKRNIFGKKLRKIRKQGIIPANIFGSDFKSVSISVSLKDFLKTYKAAKQTGIVYLHLDNEEIPTLIKQVQKHPVTDQILHIDFRKIDLKKKIVTDVPVKIVGQSEAVSQKGGVLLTLSETLSIEALPENIPQAIEVDISSIKEIGQEIKVADIAKSNKYEIKTPAEKVVVAVVKHKEESVAPETTAVAPEIITQAPAETTSEKEAVKEDTAAKGDKKSEDTASPKSAEKK